MVFAGVPLFDQEFRGSDKVIKDVLLLVQHAVAMPVFSKLIAAAQLDVNVYATMLQQQQHGVAVEERRASQIEPAVAREQRGVLAVLDQTFLAHHKHGQARAVFGVEPELLYLILVRVNSGFHTRPHHRGSLKADFIDCWRDCIGNKTKEACTAVPASAKIKNTAQCGHGNIGHGLAVELKNLEL